MHIFNLRDKVILRHSRAGLLKNRVSLMCNVWVANAALSGCWRVAGGSGLARCDSNALPQRWWQ